MNDTTASNAMITCPNCGADIAYDDEQEYTVCSYCDCKVFIDDAMLEDEIIVRYYDDPVPPIKRGLSKLVKGVLITLAVIGVLFVAGIVVVLYSEYQDANKYSSNPAHGVFVRDPEAKIIHTVNPGTPVLIHDWEITIGDTVEWRVVDPDERVSYSGMDAVRVPITITNKSDDTQNLSLFFIKVYGVESISVHQPGMFHIPDDDCIEKISSVRSGVTVIDKYFHFMYDGDGYYNISFETPDEAWEVRLYVEKPS